MRYIFSLLLIVLTGCIKLVPEKPVEVDETKKRIEKQREEMEETLKLDNSYKIEGRYIYFYSPEQKLVKNIDVMTRNEFYFDDEERLMKRVYHPKKEVRSLGRGGAFQSVDNYYNTLALLTRSEVWMYGVYNNSVTYTYDNLLRLTEEVYRDAKENIYTKKKYSYKNSFYIDRISTYDRGNNLLEVEEYKYSGGRLVAVVYMDGNGAIKDQDKLSYMNNKLVERTQKGKKEKYSYTGDLLQRIDEFDSSGILVAYHEISYDRSGREIRKDSYSPEGVLTMRIEYSY